MQNSKVLADEAGSIYDRAVSGLMKTNMLMYFAYADFEEVRLQINQGKGQERPRCAGLFRAFPACSGLF